MAPRRVGGRDAVIRGRAFWGRSGVGAPVPPSYHLGVSKTSVEIDHDILEQAAEILGTTTLRATVDAALHEIVHARRRLELVTLLGQEGRFDFEAAERAWGSAE